MSNKKNHSRDLNLIRINEIRTPVRAAYTAAMAGVVAIVSICSFVSDSGTPRGQEARAADVSTATTITTVEVEQKMETETSSTSNGTATSTTSTATTTTTTTSSTTSTTTTTSETTTTSTTTTEATTVAEVIEESEEVSEEPIAEETADETPASTDFVWDGLVLSPSAGRIQGPSGGSETYYNMYMGGVISLVQSECGLYYDYWIREDGVKMYGDYVMVAADFDVWPRGTVVQTSLGQGLVCDTGGFAGKNGYPVDGVNNWITYQLDIATNW